MNKFKFFWVVMLFSVFSCGNAQNTKVNEELSRGRAFIKTMEELIKTTSIKDYMDRTTLSKGIKPKLVVSDLKINPVFTGIYENEYFIIAPNSEILKSKAEIYLQPTDILISKDSCFVEFQIVNNFNHLLKGCFTLIPDKPTLNYDVTTFTCTARLEDVKLMKF